MAFSFLSISKRLNIPSSLDSRRRHKKNQPSQNQGWARGQNHNQTYQLPNKPFPRIKGLRRVKGLFFALDKSDFLPMSRESSCLCSDEVRRWCMPGADDYWRNQEGWKSHVARVRNSVLEDEQGEDDPLEALGFELTRCPARGDNTREKYSVVAGEVYMSGALDVKPQGAELKHCSDNDREREGHMAESMVLPKDADSEASEARIIMQYQKQLRLRAWQHAIQVLGARRVSEVVEILEHSHYYLDHDTEYSSTAFDSQVTTACQTRRTSSVSITLSEEEEQIFFKTIRKQLPPAQRMVSENVLRYMDHFNDYCDCHRCDHWRSMKLNIREMMESGGARWYTRIRSVMKSVSRHYSE